MTTCTDTRTCTPVEADADRSDEPRRAEPRRTVRPRADVWETDDAAHVLAEIPGATKDGLSITVEDQRLVLTARVELPSPEGRLVHAEWRPADYERTFLLSRDADLDGIRASLKHGLLHLVVPKRAELRPRTIAVRVAD